MTAFVAALAAALFINPIHTHAQEQAQVSDSEDKPRAVPGNIALVRALDKITARITELEVPVGSEVQFGTLSLKVEYCRTRPPIEPPETFVYLKIEDQKHGSDKPIKVFEGWMVASDPALNPLEHPVYDVWVINCKMVSADASSGKR